MKKIVLLLILLCSGCGNSITSFNENEIVIDVRSTEEYNREHIKNAKSIPLEEIEKVVPIEITDKNTKIYVYCQSGTRSELALSKLEKMGYNNVEDLGGISDKYELEGEWDVSIWKKCFQGGSNWSDN